MWIEFVAPLIDFVYQILDEIELYQYLFFFSPWSDWKYKDV